MINIPTTEIVSMPFDVLVYWILGALIVGIIIGFEIRGLLLKYRIVNIQPEQVKAKNEILSAKI